MRYAKLSHSEVNSIDVTEFSRKTVWVIDFTVFFFTGLLVQFVRNSTVCQKIHSFGLL